MRIAAACSLAVALGLTTIVIGGEIVVEKESHPIPFTTGGDEGAPVLDAILEASAVEPIGDGSHLLVAHDKKPGCTSSRPRPVVS